MDEFESSTEEDRGAEAAHRAAPTRGEPPRAASSRADPELTAFLARSAGGLAHEIKNPLSTIAINLALLEEDWQRAATQRATAAEPPPRETRSLKRISTLKREVARLEQIVDEFLHFVRGTEINRSPLDIAAVVRDALEFVETEDDLLEIRHYADLAVGLPLVLLDGSAFRQAVLNLLVNARQAMPGGGELLVRLRREGSWVELSITDTGVGMSPDQLEHCFDVYWSSKRTGTGLGLPAVKRIVEEHGGAVEVVSDEGRGTSFSIWLPLVPELSGLRRRREAGDIVVEGRTVPADAGAEEDA